MLDAFRYLSIGLPGLVLARIVQQGLWRSSPFSGFTIFLVVGLLRDLILLFPQYYSHSYAGLWMETLPFLLCAQALAGLTTYAAISRLYPGMGRFAVWLFGASLLIAGIAGLIPLPVEIRHFGAEEAMLRSMFLTQRWLATVLAGGLLLALLYLSHFPSPLRQIPRNIKLHTACIAAYFSSYVALYGVENLYKLDGAHSFIVAQLAFICVIYAGWLGLSAKGQVGEQWPMLDPAVAEMLDARQNAAQKVMRQAAGDGRK